MFRRASQELLALSVLPEYYSGAPRSPSSADHSARIRAKRVGTDASAGRLGWGRKPHSGREPGVPHRPSRSIQCDQADSSHPGRGAGRYLARESRAPAEAIEDAASAEAGSPALPGKREGIAQAWYFPSLGNPRIDDLRPLPESPLRRPSVRWRDGSLIQLRARLRFRPEALAAVVQPVLEVPIESLLGAVILTQQIGRPLPELEFDRLFLRLAQEH